MKHHLPVFVQSRPELSCAVPPRSSCPHRTCTKARRNDHLTLFRRPVPQFAFDTQFLAVAALRQGVVVSAPPGRKNPRVQQCNTRIAGHAHGDVIHSHDPTADGSTADGTRRSTGDTHKMNESAGTGEAVAKAIAKRIPQRPTPTTQPVEPAPAAGRSSPEPDSTLFLHVAQS